MSSGFQLRDFNYFFQYTKPTQVKYQGYFETLRQVEKGKILFIPNTGKEKPQSIKITLLGRFCKLSNNNEQRISVRSHSALTKWIFIFLAICSTWKTFNTFSFILFYNFTLLCVLVRLLSLFLVYYSTSLFVSVSPFLSFVCVEWVSE